MSEVVEKEIRTLRAQFWSARDPEGRAFAPLADAYRRKGELEEAVSLVEDGLARLPEFTPGHLVASRIHRARGDLIGARSSLDRVLGLDPENVLALLERAEVAREEGDSDAASTDLRRLLELDPGHMGAKAALARLETAPTEPAGSAAAEIDPFDFGLVGAGGSQPSTEEPGLGESDEPEEESPSLLEEDPGLELEAPLDLGEDPESSERLDPGDGPEPDEAFADPDLDEEPAAPAGADLDAAARLDDALAAGEAFDPDDPGEVDRPELLTRTMAELFAKQGLHDQAVEVYEHLVEREPDDAELASRLEELRATPRDVDSDESGPGSAPATGSPPLGETDDGLPLAEASSPGRDSEAEPTIREHFADLLSWRPGALPIERLHPDAPPESAPAGSRAWARGLGAVPIEDLAPGAPLRTAPQGSAAAARAAAEESGDGTAAPVRSGSGEEDRGEDDLDDFRAWLEGLGP